MTIETLHTKHGKYLLSCLKLYGVPDSECEDARQDLYLKLLEGGYTIRDTGVRGFCSTIARNAARDWNRKLKRTPALDSMVAVNEDGEEGVHPEVEEQAALSWDSMMSNSNIERIAQAMELAQMYECEPDGLTAYTLLEDLLGGLTMEQIGEKNSVNKATISRWLREWHDWIGEILPKCEPSPC